MFPDLILLYAHMGTTAPACLREWFWWSVIRLAGWAYPSPSIKRITEKEIMDILSTGTPKPQTMAGSDPGSVFTIFAGDGKYVYGVRAWMLYIDGNTHVLWRVRIEADPETAISGTDYGRVLSEKYAGKVSFTGRSPKHVSMPGMFIMQGIRRKTEAIATVGEHKPFHTVFNVLTHLLFGGDSSPMIYSPDNFANLMLEAVKRDALPDDPSVIAEKVQKLP